MPDFKFWLRSLFYGLLSTFSIGASHADMLDDIRAKGLIRIMISDGVPEFCFRDGKGQLTGSDVATAQLLAKDLGVKMALIQIPHSERVNGLTKDTGDIVVSALSITPERERVIAFSVPYARLTTVIAAPDTYRLYSMKDLGGARVGVVAHTSNAAQIAQQVPTAKLVEYSDDPTLSKAYATGEVDIISAVESLITETNKLSPKKPLIKQFVQMEFEIAVGLQRNEKTLRDWINNWVVSNLKNGRLNDIYRTYHGRNLPENIFPRTPSKP